MCARVGGDGIWLVTHTPTGKVKTRAEIDILKPDRPETLIEAPQLFPGGAAEHEKSSGRLFDALLPHRIEIQATIVPIHGIARPNLINTEDFEDESGGRGEAAGEKSGLGETIWGEQKSAGGSDARVAETRRENIDTALDIRIRIEQEHEGSAGGANTLIDGGGETGIGCVCEQWDLAALDFGARGIGGSVIHDDDFEIARGGVETRKGIETISNFGARVIGDDDNCDTVVCQGASLRWPVSRKYQRQ
jgi:hypothetical protein